jgi:predicted dehydrogenase
MRNARGRCGLPHPITFPPTCSQGAPAMSRQTRRTFLKRAAATAGVAATFTIAGTRASGRVLGANDVIRVGVAGIRGRGGGHISSYVGMDKVQVTYLIDPDSSLFAGRAEVVKKRGGNDPKCVQDVREALGDPNLDAISIATCNHWHSLMTIWACQAGKDVYVEKPSSHNVFEGRQCVAAAAKYKRIVQHGTQGRSGGGWQTARDIAEGKRGKLLVSRGTCFKRRGSIGFKEVEEVPADLDFDLWLGPAPKQPFHRNLVHYNWHWFWDTGNGDIGNQGVHQMDVARWMIPNATMPKRVFSVGGRFGYEDQAETPNTQIAIFDFDGTWLLFEVRGLPTEGGVGNNQVFDRDAAVESVEIKTHPGVKSPVAERGPGGGIFGNFIECVRSRRTEDLDAHILEGHFSSALGHLANISYRLGEEVPFDKRSGGFGDNKVFSEAFASMQEHLKDNGVKLADTKYRLGRVLEFDAATEKFVGDPEADKLLTRPPRPPFAVPEVV